MRKAKTVTVKPFVNTLLKGKRWPYSRDDDKIYLPVYLYICFNGNNNSIPILMDNGNCLYATKEDFDLNKIGALEQGVIESNKYLAQTLAKLMLEIDENLTLPEFGKEFNWLRQDIFKLVKDYFINDLAKDYAKTSLSINQYNLLNIDELMESERQLDLYLKTVKTYPLFTLTARVLVALHAYQARAGIAPGYFTLHHWRNEYGREKFKACMQKVDYIINIRTTVVDELYPLGKVSRKFGTDFMPIWSNGDKYADAIDEIIEVVKRSKPLFSAKNLNITKY